SPSSFALQLAVCAPAPVTRFPGTVPGPCFADSHSPRPPPLAPLTPQPVARLCSLASRLYGGGRLLIIVHHRLRLLAFPTRASAARMLVLADHEISRFPNKERAHMPVSKTTPGRLGARVIAPIRGAFRHRNDVGTQDEGTFAAQWLAYALPCQRFANTLTGTGA